MLCNGPLTRYLGRYASLQSCRTRTFHFRWSSSVATEFEGTTDEDAYRRQRKTEWKRRQGGQSFLDHLIISVRGGKGGNGCAAFNREKFVPYGPPSGGNGGRGGDVYILPTTELTTLSTVAKRVKGNPGGHGKGAWMNGRAGEPTIVRVPVGTVIRELPADDPRRAHDAWEAEEDGLAHLSDEERTRKMRERRWVHYPGAEEDNVERDAFKEAERQLYRHERDKRLARLEMKPEPIFLDLAKEDLAEGTGTVVPTEGLGYLIASGGDGGLGNPTFLTANNRAPKFATRGTDGHRITLELELKILADIGLVGYPNAGKSTLLRALTAGGAQTEIAGYAFTTLNPTVAVVRMTDDGRIVNSVDEELVFEETIVEEQLIEERMRRGELANALTRNQILLTKGAADDGDNLLQEETFRFTVSDNPGLISRASENVGLGHSFLRGIERSLALVYVVDLQGPTPEEELKVLREELEAYKPGLSSKARLVIANKADLLSSDNNVDLEAARAKLKRLEEFVKSDFSTGPDQTPLDVIPTSAKYSQNLQKVLINMRMYVEEARGQSL
ncbi:GTP-binding protein Obg/CgtA [Schizopora paradoxa]|uniref:GTP-binding protein Obg/CgtA n=1 Tax=Schizopora paradoxa TaxID=27342 RepID=A0A0H2RUH7_9AGAM|nr:GTP-binding protein Obg/CgtA [Schizopora paradoxa]